MNRRTALGALAAAVAGGGIARTFGAQAWGADAERYLFAPADAGALLRDHPPGPSQVRAWSIGFASWRVLAYYWDLPPAGVTSATVSDDELHDHDLILVDRRHLPDWYPAAVTTLAERGAYALVTGASLRAADTGT